MNRRFAPSEPAPVTFIRVLAAASLLLLAACESNRQGGEERATVPANEDSAPANGGASEPLRPEESRVLGVFVDPKVELAKAIVAPDSVRAGEPFVMTITTTGSGCERVGDEGILLGQREATVMVYDFTSANRPNVDCTMELKMLKHEVTLSFIQPGPAVIRVWGRRQRLDSPPYGVPDVIEHRMVVH